MPNASHFFFFFFFCRFRSSSSRGMETLHPFPLSSCINEAVRLSSGVYRERVCLEENPSMTLTYWALISSEEVWDEAAVQK